MTRLAQIAASKGDLVIVKWVCGIFTERDSNGTLHYLTENVNLWQIAQNAADYDQLNVLKWIMDEPNRTVLLFELCSRGIDATPPVKINFNKAAAGGHISVLTWLIQHYPEMCNGNEADFTAAENGHLDILHLLLSSPIEKSTSLRAVNAAAENGHLNIVKYLAAEGYSVDHAMDVSAEDRLLDIVKWLHENTSDSCSTRAMDGAAYNGHLDVVKWLHRNREEGCTDFAMDGAVDQGHLLVVQWLHENRTEGCTTAAMNEAAIVTTSQC